VWNQSSPVLGLPASFHLLLRFAQQLNLRNLVPWFIWHPFGRLRLIQEVVAEAVDGRQAVLKASKRNQMLACSTSRCR
jgi:hypothetical protein